METPQKKNAEIMRINLMKMLLSAMYAVHVYVTNVEIFRWNERLTVSQTPAVCTDIAQDAKKKKINLPTLLLFHSQIIFMILVMLCCGNSLYKSLCKWYAH